MQINVFDIYLYRNCNIDAQDDKQRTPLIYAVHYNHTAVVRILLENNADMQLKDETGVQPIHMAAIICNYEYVNVHF